MKLPPHFFEVNNLAIGVGHALNCYARAKAVPMHARIGVACRIMVEAVSGIKGKFARQFHAPLMAQKRNRVNSAS
jgi:predicted secreted protein